MKQILAVLVILAIFLSGAKSSPIPSQARDSGQQPQAAHGQQQAPYMVNQMQAMSNWLGRLHGLLTETALPPDMPPATTSPSPNSSTAKPVNLTILRYVQLAKQDPEHAWEGHSSADSTWKEFEPSRLVVNTSNVTGGVLVATYGAHIQESTPFLARFVVNEGAVVTDGSGPWGTFFTAPTDIAGQYRPFCFAQMFNITQETEAKVKLQTQLSAVKIRGGGAMVAAFPRPASLSTKKVDFQRDDSIKHSEPPHNINVTAGTKALLIMTFNGMSSAPLSEGSCSLSFEVDDTSPTAHRDDDNGHKFGFYLNDHAGTASKFVSLTQLAVVEYGLHTARVVAEGEPFEVSSGTSQVMTIPANSAQIHTKRTDDWEVTTDPETLRQLIELTLETSENNSILVISTSFIAYTQCGDPLSGSSYYQFNVDEQRVYPSDHGDHSQFGAWREERWGGTGGDSHGSMLVFTRAGPGTHKVDLIHRNIGSCQYTTKAAVLQVGVVPGDYTNAPEVISPDPVVADPQLDLQRSIAQH